VRAGSIGDDDAYADVAHLDTPVTDSSAASAPACNRSLRRAAPADVDWLSAALASAFEDDPVFGWLMPDESKRLRRLSRFFKLELLHIVLSNGHVWTFAETIGASLELPPGSWRVPLATQLAHGPTFMRVFGARLPHATALLALMERRHVREPHYYIPYVGVAPPWQGHGLGTALLTPTLDRCDTEGFPAYLEATSERNAALYERLGFVATSELHLGGSPPLWPMVRPQSIPPADQWRRTSTPSQRLRQQMPR
jgi:GNAT superfamily N-acetyltransferase